MDIWAQLSAPLPDGVISWRQDGRPIQRDGKFFARFVAYIEANTVRERLDSVVPGEWDLTLELLPTLVADDDDESRCSFKARLQILGVIREDVGTARTTSRRRPTRSSAPRFVSASRTSCTRTSRTGCRSTATASTRSRSRIRRTAYARR